MNSRASNLNTKRAIALVITLLMLSVITFLAVAFLVMTRRDTSAKLATLDVSTAQAMSEAALARAQAEIIARMTAQTDVLAYDFMVSSNYISPGGYTNMGKGVVDTNDVNYDYTIGGNGVTAFGLTPSTDRDWAQNIANLFFDPRPPVFVLTNTDPTRPASDFRYYVDLNRNGAFEGSSFRTVGKLESNPDSLAVLPNTSGQQGEPEWIGVLQDPTHPHSRDNQFVGRYAYMVLPIGKTLDLNFIHNDAKRWGYSWNGGANDAFSRDQGVGSWELNLAGYLWALNTNTYGGFRTFQPYNYPVLQGAARSVLGNIGDSFFDAERFLAFRYGPNRGIQNSLGSYFFDFQIFSTNGIDDYGSVPSLDVSFPYDYDANTDPDNPKSQLVKYRTDPWPGSFTENMFYDMQDVFDTNRTGTSFPIRLGTAGGLTNTLYDRYTYQRMLASIGTGSAPEYGVFVYTNEIVTNRGRMPTWLKTKMNLNYDNSAQIAQGPYTPMPTNLVLWTNAVEFFTNAADLLLRTQDFAVSNTFPTQVVEYHHFGINSMHPYYPIYSETNSSYRYTAQLHRMLQVAANLYDATANGNQIQFRRGSTNVAFYPSVFRPIFLASNGCLYIVGYSNVFPGQADQQLAQRWHYMTDANLGSGNPINRNDNVYGVPWVIGAVKGLPSFNAMSIDTCLGVTRRLNFTRPSVSSPPNQTNQSYELSFSNHFGLMAWNSYHSIFDRPVEIKATNYMSVLLTNNYSAGMALVTNYGTNILLNAWRGWNNRPSDPGSMLTPLAADTVLLPQRKYIDTGGPPGFYVDGVGPLFDTNRSTYHNWYIIMTNTMLYVLQDLETRAVLDFVNLGPAVMQTNFLQDITNKADEGGLPPVVKGTSGNPSWFTVWNRGSANDSPSSPLSTGAQQQILVGEGSPTVSDWAPTQTAAFANFMKGSTDNTNLSMSDPFQPSVFLVDRFAWEADDPLVHYTSEDLRATHYPLPPPDPTKFVTESLTTYAGDGLGSINPTYMPWPGTTNKTLREMTGVKGNVVLNDPQITQSDDWQFPTNKLPNVGWIGRVHRGTAWQTIYLKADPAHGTGNDGANLNAWLERSGVNQDDPFALLRANAAFPTNDWNMLDLFTTVPNDNASTGTLSVNQTNMAAWHALFDGVIVWTNTPTNTGWVIGPATMYDTNTEVSYLMDGNVVATGRADITNYGINNIRTNQPYGYFHHVGDILQASTLTVASPFINFGGDVNDTPRDEVLERIPQQVAGLLKVGQPQFVIYAWGQSLRPSALYNGVSAPQSLFKLATNYAITGEYLTRTVCHLDLTRSDRFGSNAVLQVDSFNILPAAQ